MIFHRVEVSQNTPDTCTKNRNFELFQLRNFGRCETSLQTHDLTGDDVRHIFRKKEVL